MKNELTAAIEIQNLIYSVRQKQIMLDRDLAQLYDVETKQINRAVKRNLNRFPKEFMFQLNPKEWSNLKFQFGTSSSHGGRRTLPYALQTKSLPPKQGIFYNGQFFDAYTLVADIIRSAKDNIVLIDNYIDDKTLKLFTKRNKSVNVIIYTKIISKTLKQDIEIHNKQYDKIAIKTLKTAHDRFLIIDKKNVYHFGASLKDVGKDWFAFSLLDIEAKDILEKL